MGQSSRSLRILVVEDEADIREPIVTYLESEGYSVESADNGWRALEKIKKGDGPDLILLDMKMPGMNGWEFAKAYRSQLQNPSPILVITAAADAEARAREVGAAGWLGKPLDLDELGQKIEVFKKAG